MRQHVGHWLIRIVRRWFLPDWNPPTSVYWPTPDVIERATVLTGEWEQPGLSGEHKRHQVLARMRKDYPDLNHRTLALAIELGLL